MAYQFCTHYGETLRAFPMKTNGAREATSMDEVESFRRWHFVYDETEQRNCPSLAIPTWKLFERFSRVFRDDGLDITQISDRCNHLEDYSTTTEGGSFPDRHLTSRKVTDQVRTLTEELSPYKNLRTRCE